MEKQVIIPLGEYEELIQYKEKTPCVLITHDYGPNYSSSRIDTLKITPLNNKSLIKINEIVEQYKKDIDSRFDKAVSDFKVQRQISNINKSIDSGRISVNSFMYNTSVIASMAFGIMSIIELIYIICKH